MREARTPDSADRNPTHLSADWSESEDRTMFAPRCRTTRLLTGLLTLAAVPLPSSASGGAQPMPKVTAKDIGAFIATPIAPHRVIASKSAGATCSPAQQKTFRDCADWAQLQAKYIGGNPAAKCKCCSNITCTMPECETIKSSGLCNHVAVGGSASGSGSAAADTLGATHRAGAPCDDDDNGVVRASHGHAPNCPTVVSGCKDAKIGPLVRKYCPRTCSLCHSCTDDDTGVHAASKGQAKNCAAVVSGCKDAKIGKLVRRYCPATCKLCGETSGGAAPTSAAPKSAVLVWPQPAYTGPLATLKLTFAADPATFTPKKVEMIKSSLCTFMHVGESAISLKIPKQVWGATGAPTEGLATQAGRRLLHAEQTEVFVTGPKAGVDRLNDAFDKGKVTAIFNIPVVDMSLIHSHSKSASTRNIAMLSLPVLVLQMTLLAQ